MVAVIRPLGSFVTPEREEWSAGFGIGVIEAIEIGNTDKEVDDDAFEEWDADDDDFEDEGDEDAPDDEIDDDLDDDGLD